MSCFNCYSSRKLDRDVVDKILERGQRLRSAMVQAILNNEAINLDFNEPVCGALKADASERNIRAFLKGDCMSKEDELQTLETLRSMSAADLCKVTDRTYNSDDPCDCLTCMEYQEKDLSCDRKRDDNANQITKKIQERYKNENGSLLKFVDSIKIAVANVTLNEAGERKIQGSITKDKASSIAQTFFLEYQIPESLTKTREQIKGKVNSGLTPNHVRICARRTELQTINFKQTSIHTIKDVSLEDNIIKFRLSFRSSKQKHPVQLGIASFNMSSLNVNKNLTCNQELCVRLQEATPLNVGVLRISVQLGCGRLYFGREFTDAISNNKENSVILGSDDLSVSSFEEVNPDNYSNLKSVNSSQPRFQSAVDLKIQKNYRPKSRTEKTVPQFQTKSINNPHKGQPIVSQPMKLVTPINFPDQPKLVLLGFLYISRAQFLREVFNSYISCNLFGEDEIVNSKPAAFDCDPVYNFCQKIPLIYEENLVLRLRENCMVIEIREKGQSKDFLIGVSTVFLHPFYLAFRNSILVKYLLDKPSPSIAVDGWEYVVDPNNDEVVGKLEVLLALGTKEQIDNLEKARGFKKEIVVSHQTLIKSKTTDVGIQAENMEPKTDIEAFLKQIVAQKQLTVDTAAVQQQSEAQPQVRSTTDLLTSLQKALSVGDTPQDRTFFKAHIFIDNALHLPSRKKCRSRRAKGRTTKHEEILPSTYVTFETYKGDIKMTHIVPKSTTPKWDYKCDVNLPVELLTNKQTSFIFKIWKKVTNTTMVPNMQTDHVIGCATVDLTVLLSGLPSIQGWYNINDLSKKCNGQINIHVTPLEKLEGFQIQNEELCCTAPEPETLPEITDEPGELLNRALKRKFTELDEITQRLRLRLSKVTDESDTSNDETADEFEKDINTLCVEDDFDMLNFEKEAHSFNLNHVREIGLLRTDRDVILNKQKIDVLLEKLSLISAENSSRYVSGCSRSPAESESHEDEKESS